MTQTERVLSEQAVTAFVMGTAADTVETKKFLSGNLKATLQCIGVHTPGYPMWNFLWKFLPFVNLELFDLQRQSLKFPL